MNIDIKYRKSKCDKDTYLYSLYVDDIYLCSYYSFEMIKKRIGFILRTGRYDLRGISTYCEIIKRKDLYEVLS